MIRSVVMPNFNIFPPPSPWIVGSIPRRPDPAFASIYPDLSSIIATSRPPNHAPSSTFHLGHLRPCLLSAEFTTTSIVPSRLGGPRPLLTLCTYVFTASVTINVIVKISASMRIERKIFLLGCNFGASSI